MLIESHTQNKTDEPIRFIDLFAGLGGFHSALKDLNCECVFASELKEDLRKLYAINFPGTPIRGDITEISPAEISAHNLLCGGFPCQPFSQAGKQQGFNDDKDRGNLFYNICDILEYHRPRYVFLENVANLMSHDSNNTWNVIFHRLNDPLEKGGLNYEVKQTILSPHQFGIPQHRKRTYIVCEAREYGCLEHFKFPEPTNEKCKIENILDKYDTETIPLRESTIIQLNVWEEFIKKCVLYKTPIPSFPIWAMEFGANYDYRNTAPAYQSVSQLCGKRGKLGQMIEGESTEQCLSCLPIYAQTSKDRQFPDWKIRYIEQNREFYEQNKPWLDDWIKKIQDFENSHMKMEWNCGSDATPTLKDKIIQFRASGIRVKLPTFSPALNLCGTQIPIFPWLSAYDEDLGKVTMGRYLTRREAARLQGMDSMKFGNNDFQLSIPRSYAALGNAVNVVVVRKIAKNLLRYE